MNTSSHKLSFVIAAYNEAPRVGKTIERVLALQLPWPYEIIVVDDGSKDETANVIRRYEPRVHLIQHDRNYGFGKAFRTGCAHACRFPVLGRPACVDRCCLRVLS